ncbi:MAG: hypothetical protein HY000_28045 [Planctomycetes bacterium]|nr:hypothetical protein [Planctomycetota bacterium]
MFRKACRQVGITVLGAMAFLLAGPGSLVEAASTTSPESGGVTYRITRIKAQHDGSFTPAEVKVDTDGSTWKITAISGISTPSSGTGTSVTFTLNDDGKNPSIGVEIEVEPVGATGSPVQEGSHTFSLIFKETGMMGRQQTAQNVSSTLAYSVAKAINQPAVSSAGGSALFSGAAASTPSGSPQPACTMQSTGCSVRPSPPPGVGCAWHPPSCPKEEPPVPL